ncbi:HAD family hydrolase [Streptomyces sp. NPDC059506]|uniref:HAD family hydrolase n=1 Tax=Streptomyces TaxID=1883 RepID=UPI000CB62DD5|nr:HAD family hydrolase [Streptomyces sp. SCUT-3]PLW71844.1 hydrolase [Streptomyces sp. DJ]QMV23515.1 HAD-IA family hydrolase [Streptomyces sp. SCUT-3]
MSPAVLFDMDGTLVDTPGAIVTTLCTVLEELGTPRPDALEVRATVGRPLVPSFASLLRLDEGDPTVSRAAERFRTLFRDTVVPDAPRLVLPGVVTLLQELRSDGHPLAVVTSKVRAGAEEMLESAGLASCFDAVVCHGMAERGKPHPDLALLAADLLRRPAAECVVVGDAVDDMRMARSAGMTAIGVSYGVADTRALFEAGAHRVEHSAPAVGRALSELTLSGSTLSGPAPDRAPASRDGEEPPYPATPSTEVVIST